MIAKDWIGNSKAALPLQAIKNLIWQFSFHLDLHPGWANFTLLCPIHQCKLPLEAPLTKHITHMTNFILLVLMDKKNMTSSMIVEDQKGNDYVAALSLWGTQKPGRGSFHASKP